jgi:tetratricopeptide (TPR) repeat protein
MTAYRDDLEAAVHRAEALETELRCARERQREDRAGYLVKVTELEADLADERARLQAIEAQIAALAGAGGIGAEPGAAGELVAQLAASRARLEALGADVRTATASVRAPPSPRRRRVAIAILGLVAALAVSAVVVVLHGAVTASRREASRREALALTAQGSYAGFVATASALERLLAEDGDDPRLLADLAWVRARMALEFGTDDDVAAASLVERAQAAGAAADFLALPRTAIALTRGDMVGADQVLLDITLSTGDFAPELIYLRGVWYMRKDNADEALRRFAASAEAYPGEVQMSLAHAWALHASTRHAEALSRLDHILRGAPQSVGARLLKARILIETNANPSGGDQLAQEVIELPAGQAAPGQLGWAWLLRARRNSNALAPRPYPEERAAVLGMLRRARANRPLRDPEFSALVASTLLDVGEPGDARAEAEDAVRLAPQNDDYRLLLSRALFEVGDPGAAEAGLRGLVSPSGSEASLLRGRIAFSRGDYDLARSAFEEAARSEREGRLARTYLGRLHLARYEADEAIEHLRAVTSVPIEDDPVAYDLLGDAYAMRGDRSSFEAARAEYARALELRPDDGHALVGLAELLVGGSNLSALLAAISDAERAVADVGEPEDPSLAARIESLNGRVAYDFLGEVERARALFTRALGLDDSLADAHLGLGLALRQQGRAAEACEHYRRYLSLFERAPEQSRRLAQDGADATCR